MQPSNPYEIWDGSARDQYLTCEQTIIQKKTKKNQPSKHIFLDVFLELFTSHLFYGSKIAALPADFKYMS